MTAHQAMSDIALAPHEINTKAAVKQLAADLLRHAGCRTSEASQKRLERRAWSILLDQGAAGSPEPVSDHAEERAHRNRLGVRQASIELRQQLRPAEANQLEQLLSEWHRTTHYIPWTPQDPQDITLTPGPAPLTDHEAVVSLLLRLRGSSPQPAPAFTGLPPLGSTTVAAIQRRAEAAVAATAAGGGSSSGAIAAAVLQDAVCSRDDLSNRLLMMMSDKGHVDISKAGKPNWLPAVVAATEMLQKVPLDAALLSASGSAADTDRRDQGHSVKSAAAAAEDVSLVDSLLTRMQQSSQPYQGLNKPLGLSSKSAAAGQAGSGSSNISKYSSTGKLDQQAVDDVSRTAVDAEAAVAAAAAMQPRVMSLILQSTQQPGSTPLALLGQQQQARDVDAILAACGCWQSKPDKELGTLVTAQQQQNGADVLQQQQPKHNMSRAETEEQLVALSCLAVQGVWSAVGRLWDLALQGSPNSSSSSSGSSNVRCGLVRPAAQHHLIVQILHIAELRLRLQAFLQHFQGYSSKSSSSGDDTDAATGSAVLHAFLAAVQEVLDMHDAAMQAVQHRQQQQQQLLRHWQCEQQRSAPAAAAATAVLPAMTLLQLVVVLRNMREQLEQLATYCWCTVDLPADNSCDYSLSNTTPGSSSTQHKFAPSWQPCQLSASAAAAKGSSRLSSGKPAGNRRTGFYSEAAAAAARAVAAEARAAALPWPAAAAAWVRLWGWDPSRWQIQRRFMTGSALAETLYASLLHAGPQTAPLLRHLFAAAVQPLLHQIHNWAYLPDIHAAEAAAAAANITSITAKKVDRSCSRRASRNGSRNGSNSQVPASRLPLTLAAATAAAASDATYITQSSGVASSGACTTVAAAVDDTAAEAAAAHVLITAWEAAQDRAPECPSFLAGVQQHVAVAGLQLQLLQLLGPRGQQLAQRLGWLAEMEQQELRDVLSSRSSSSKTVDAVDSVYGQQELQQQRSLRLSAVSDGGVAVAAAGVGQREAAVAAGGGGTDSMSFTGLSLLLGGKGGVLSAAAESAATGMAAAVGGRGGSGAAYLPFNLTTDQLKHAAAMVADYEAARHAELSRVVSDLVDVKTAAAVAETARAIARQQQAAEAEEAKQQLQQAAAARKAARKRQLLLQQQEEIAVAAARRAKARMDELSYERSLLAQAAAEDHKVAMQRLQAEVKAAQKLGVQLKIPSLQQQQEPYAAADTTRQVSAQEQPSTATAASKLAAAAKEDLLQSHDYQQQSGNQQQHQQQQQQQEDKVNAVSAPARAHWGPAVFDPSPAAGRPSAGGAEPPLAVIGSAAAAAVPAAGKRSNSVPRVLPGMGSVLNPESRQRPSSGGGLGSRKSSLSGEVQFPGIIVAAAAAEFGGFHKPNSTARVNMGKWGVPVVPGPAAGLPSARQHRRTNSASGLLAAAAGSSGIPGILQQQQRRQTVTFGETLSARALAVRGCDSDVIEREELSADDVVLDLTDEDMKVAEPAAAAAAGGSSASMSKWQQQQQQGLVDSKRATGAGSDHDLTLGGSTYQQQRQGHQQEDSTAVIAAADSSAPLVTTFEVLVIRPLLAQHKLTTVACWQLLLQEQQLLTKLSAMQALFFQQQADWVDLLLDGVEQLLQQPAADVVSVLPNGHTEAQAAAGNDGPDGDNVDDEDGGTRHLARSQGVLSPVAVQLVLEAAVQQSCLAGDAAAERLSIKVENDRLLPGWGQCRTLRMHSQLPSSSSAHSASATDGLLLQYQLPWPVGLLVNEQQQQQYGQIFSVLLRLRRLQKQLTKQWATINARPGSTAAAGSRRNSRQDNARKGPSRVPLQEHSEAAGDDSGKAEDSAERLQQLRRWHAMAMHSISSLLGTMLSELSGKLWGTFESEITLQPVSLPDIIEAHARLLAAAQEVCLLPQSGSSSGRSATAAGDSGSSSNATTPTGVSSLRKGIGRMSLSMEFGALFGSPRVAAAAAVNGTTVADVVYQLADAAWFLQQQVQQVLLRHMDAAAASVPVASSSNFREGSSSRALASILAEDDIWHGVNMAGWKLEGLVRMLKGQLASNRAVGVGEALAGLAARMGITS